MSLAALLAEIADERRREAAWRSEREATRLDAGNADAQAETYDWDSAADDDLA